MDGIMLEDWRVSSTVAESGGRSDGSMGDVIVLLVLDDGAGGGLRRELS